MSNNYWIKLYHEILEDPKMGRLPDNVWRRCLEIFLLAGKFDVEGHLPDTDDLAWHLRQDDLDKFHEEVAHLERVGILTKTDSGWLVTNFTKRQAPIQTVDRVRAFRERKRKEALTGPLPELSEPETMEEIESDVPVTHLQPIVTRTVTDRYIDIESDKDSTSSDEEVPEKSGEAAQDDQSKTNQKSDGPKKQLMGEFMQTTGLKFPKSKPQQGFWWAQMGEILHLVDNDVGRGRDLIRQTVDAMQKEALTISTPKSIINPARSLLAKLNGHAHAPPPQPSPDPAVLKALENFVPPNQR